MSTPSFGSDELAQFRRTFFEECTELLADLEERLGALVAFSSDVEGLNAIFRAVHSVKGGAGAFGLEDLVRFAHVFETVMDDLRSAEVDFITIGQYLAPSRKHHAVIRFVTPDEFKSFETIAYVKGFLMVSATPLTRSSHHAGEDFAKLRAARAAKTGA